MESRTLEYIKVRSFNFYDISEMLDLTQDNDVSVAIEKEEDDFKRLQALKHKKDNNETEPESAIDVELKSKSSKKEKLDKKKLSRTVNKKSIKEKEDLNIKSIEQKDKTQNEQELSLTDDKKEIE